MEVQNKGVSKLLSRIVTYSKPLFFCGSSFFNRLWFDVCRWAWSDYFYHLIIKDKLASIYLKLTHCLKFDIFTRLSFEVRG